MTTSRRPRGPRGTNVIDHVRAFFTNNPDEELTFPDLQVKFGLTQAAARGVISKLREENFPVESVHVLRHKSKGIAR